MSTARYVYWQDGDKWLGYFEEYPDYMTQGESLDDLRNSCKDLFHDLTSGDSRNTQGSGTDGSRKRQEFVRRLEESGCVLVATWRPV